MKVAVAIDVNVKNDSMSTLELIYIIVSGINGVIYFVLAIVLYINSKKEEKLDKEIEATHRKLEKMMENWELKRKNLL